VYAGEPASPLIHHPAYCRPNTAEPPTRRAPACLAYYCQHGRAGRAAVDRTGKYAGGIDRFGAVWKGYIPLSGAGRSGQGAGKVCFNLEGGNRVWTMCDVFNYAFTVSLNSACGYRRASLSLRQGE